MKQYDFDYTPSRWNTFSLKWDIKPNELPMWVADMDFETAPEVKEAMVKKKSMENCKERYVLADSSKFSQISSVKFSEFENATIITTELKNASYKKYKNIKEV